MGCDSHPYIEVYNTDTGEWEMVDEKYHYYDIMEKNRGNPDFNISELYEGRPSYINALGNRNYTLFAAIANVRNYGDERIKPFDFAERGMPDDASQGTREAIEEDYDLHSHTYFTLRELMDAPWDEVGGHEELALFADDFTSWKETGVSPTHGIEAGWASTPYYTNRATKEGVTGLKGFHRRVTEEEMVLTLLSGTDGLVREHDGLRFGPFISKRLPVTYALMLPNLKGCLADLAKLAADPCHVRVVIAFDN